jgi:hypothetical protein
MKTITTTVYEFNELSDKAKEKARDWYRDGAFLDEWWLFTYEDAERAGLKIESFGLDRSRHAEGKLITSARECAESIIKDHGEACETFKTAQAFLKERDEIVDTANRDENGELDSVKELDDALDRCESEFLKSILEDYSIILQKESEYIVSDEAVDENITANGYTFTKDGKREG